MQNANGKPGLVIALGDKPDADAGAGGDVNELSAAANVDTVPLNMLEMPDDQEQMQPPEVGDEVNYQVAGKVVAIEGGTAKIQRTSINGQELKDQDGDDDDTGDGSQSQGGEAGPDDDLQKEASGIGMMSVLLFFFLLFAPCARAQSAIPVGNAAYTNSLVVSTTFTKVRAITGYESATSQFIQVFNAGTVPSNGSVPLFSFPVAAGQYFSFDFSFYGVDLDACVVCTSSTANVLTLGAADCSIQAIKSK